jgi:predicted RNA binding protein YcfA (HicA-like mRNA interferase family)
MSQFKKLVAAFLNRPARVRFEDVQSVLGHFGFECKNTKGSHSLYRHPDGRKVTVIVEGGQRVKGVYVERIVETLNLEAWYAQQE